MGKRPAIQFYPGDWLRDSVSGCSLAAQGLWLRMLLIGHDSERYGYLIQNGKSIPPESIARRCGCTPEQYSSLLCELDDAGVISRTPEGIIFSRRMVRDEKERIQTKKRVEKHRSNAACNAPVTPLYEEEVEEEKAVEVAFSLEAFDFEESFLALHAIYPRRKDNHATRNFYIEAIEKVVKKHGFRRSEAAGYILSRAEIYVSKSKFVAGLDRFLCDGIYEQDESMWGGDGANQQNGPQRISAATARNERNADAIANVARKIGIDPSLATTGGSPAQGRADGRGHRVLASEPIVIPPTRD